MSQIVFNVMAYCVGLVASVFLLAIIVPPLFRVMEKIINFWDRVLK